MVAKKGYGMSQIQARRRGATRGRLPEQATATGRRRRARREAPDAQDAPCSFMVYT